MVGLANLTRVLTGAIFGFALASAASPASAQTIQQFFNKVLPLVSEPSRPGVVERGQTTHSADRLSMTGIAAMQELLGRLGYDAGTADGVFGRRTRSAMNQFQRDHGFAVTQVPDQATLDALRAAVSTARQGQDTPRAQDNVAAAAPGVVQPGFDCRLSSTPTERAICDSVDLSRMDRDISTIYAAIRETSDGTARVVELDAQRKFIRARDACGADTYCLFPVYLARLDTIRESAHLARLIVTFGQDGAVVTRVEAAPLSPSPLPPETMPEVPGAGLAGNVAQAPAARPHAPAEEKRRSFAADTVRAGADLSLLRHPPDALIPWSFDTFQGVPHFNKWHVGSVMTLALMNAIPGYLDDNQCDISQRFLRPEVLNQVQTREHDKCRNGKIVWPGANEFEKQDNEKAFLNTYAPLLAAQAIELPVTFAVSDVIGLAAFDTASSSFPLMDSERHLINAVMGTFPNQTSFLGPKGDTSRRTVVGSAPLPEQKLPVSGPEEARRLIADVTGWVRRDAQGQIVSHSPDSPRRRTVRRVAIIELTSVDPQNGRINARLKSLGLYNLDLTRQLHEFPVSSSAGSIVADGLPPAFSVPQSMELDAFYAAIRRAADDDGSISEADWMRIGQIIHNRDKKFYTAQLAGKPELQDLQLDDTQRPFLTHGEHGLGMERVPLLRQWAGLLGKAMPAEIEQTSPITYRGKNAVVTFTAPGWDSQPEHFAAAEAMGFQTNQLVALKDMPGVLVALPNAASLYTLELPASTLNAHMGKEISARTLMKANGPVRFVANGERVIALLPMSPQSISIMANDVVVASRSFEDVPHLDSHFMAGAMDNDGYGDGMAFAQPQPFSNAAANLLTAALVDDATEGLVYLAAQRAQLELSGDAVGGRFFVEGKRAPTVEEAAVLVADFQSWARRRVGADPGVIALDAAIGKRTLIGPASTSWSDLLCLGSTRDAARISSNQRVLSARIAVAEMGGGTLSTEENLHKLAVEREPLLADMVVRIGCDREAERHSLLPIYAVFSSALPAGPENAATVRLEVRVKKASATQNVPDYLELLPDDMRERMIDRWSPKPQQAIKLDIELVEAIYLDDDGLELARHSPSVEQTRAGIIDAYVSARDRPSLSEAGEPYGPDILGIQVGMSFDEAEALIRQYMQVGQVLKGVRAFDGTLQTGRTHPAKSGKLFISQDSREFIALIDEAPLREGRVLLAWRRLYLEPNAVRFEDAATALVEKYGNADGNILHEGWRNTWLTPDGRSNCQSTFTYGGERPDLSLSWKDDGDSDQVLMLPDGRPVPDAMIPADIRNAATKLDGAVPHCGPAFTAELVFDASRYANAGHVTHGLDWVETIISDVGPYIEAFRANREELAATGGGEAITRQPAIRF